MSPLVCLLAGVAALSPAGEPAAVSAETAKQRAVAERFLAVLERNPRPGTALDRAADFYAARGELAAVAGRYQTRTFADPADAAAPAVWGLLELRRGDVPAAVAAFRIASVRAPGDHRPRALLADGLTRAGVDAGAAAALEAALARNPPRRELPGLILALGRALNRAGRGADADAAFARLEAAFPGDDGVRERVAAALEAEGRTDAALARYEALAKNARDPVDRAGFGLKAAALTLELGRPADALAAYESLLDRFEPDAWQAAEARAGAERAAARAGGPDAVREWYRRRVAGRPGAVASSVRLAELLAGAGETGEAKDRLRAVIAAAPSDPRPRRALADLLTTGEEFAAAADQYARLAELLPGDADVVRAWADAVLNGPGVPRPAAVGKAVAVWNDWLTGRPDDAAAHARVAGWLRDAGADERALELERRAADLAPADPAFAAALAAHLHALGRREEAVAAWRRTAAGPNRTPANLARLAGTLAANGFDEDAAGVAADAVTLAAGGGDAFEPLTFGDRLRLAGVFADAGRKDAAAAQLAAAETVAATPGERARVARGAVGFARAAGRLDDRLAALAAAADRTGAAADIARLARFREAAGDAAGAADAAEMAVAADPTDDAALALAAELRSRVGRFGDAADAYAALAARDRRGRAGYLAEQIGALRRAGRPADAVFVARAAAAESPGDAAVWGRLGRAALAAGEDAAGLDALRRAAELAGDDAAFLELAAALRERGRTDDAAAALWRALAASDSFGRRRAVVRRLVENGAAPATVAGRLRAEPGLPGGEGDRLAAAAFLAAGDAAGAADALRRRLDAAPGDLAALRRLAEVEEDAGRWQSALRTRRRLAARTGDPADRRRLADLLFEAGEVEEATEKYLALFRVAPDAAAGMALIDDLLAAHRFDPAFALAEAGLADRPDDRELLYREAFAAARGSAGPAVAAETLRRLWESNLPAGDAAGSSDRVRFARSAVSEARRLAGRRYVAGVTFLHSLRRPAFQPPADAGEARLAAAVLLGRGDPPFAARLLAAAGLETVGPDAVPPAENPAAAAVRDAAEFLAAVDDGDGPRAVLDRPAGEARGEAFRRWMALAPADAAPFVADYFVRRHENRPGPPNEREPLSASDLDLFAAAAATLRPAGGDDVWTKDRWTVDRVLLDELTAAGATDRLAAVAAAQIESVASPRLLKSLTEQYLSRRLSAAAAAAMRAAAAARSPDERIVATPKYFDLAPAALAEAAAGDWGAALDLVDAHAELTSPADPPNPSRWQQRKIAVVVPRQGDRGAVSYDFVHLANPAAREPIADDQVALLRSLWRASREPAGLAELAPDGAAPEDPGGPGFLLDHLERRAAAATGEAKAREEARAAAVRAWGE